MKKKLFGIIAGLVCCGLFTAVIVWLGKSDAPDPDHEHSHEEQPEESVDPAELMLTQRTDISSVTVTNGGESFTMTISDSGEPQVKELEGIRQDSAREKALAELCRAVEAVKVVEQDAADLGKYGLDKPSCSGAIEYKGAEGLKIIIGDPSVDSEHYYAALEGQRKVWLVEKSVWRYFASKVSDYVSYVMSPEIAKEASSAEITVKRRGSDDIVLAQTDGEWKMTSPINAALDPTKSAGTVNGLYSLSAEYCYAVHPDEAAKKACGIDENSPKAVLKQGEQVFTLYMGNAAPMSQGEEKEKLLCYFEGSADTDCIYAVDREYLPWADVTVQGLISQIMLPNYLVNLRSITVTASGSTTRYDITNSGGDSTKVNEDISKMRTEKVESGGRELDLTEFRKFYKLLMNCPTEQIYTQQVKNDADITIVYTKNDGTADRLELFAAGDGYAARVNGRMSYLVKKSWADAVIVGIKALADGGSVKTDF